MISSLCAVALLLLSSAYEVSSFSLPSHHVIRTAAVRSSTTALSYYESSSLLNDTLANKEVASFIPPPFLWNSTLASLQTNEFSALIDDKNRVDDQQQEPSPAEVKRTKLKRELAHAAITGYEEDNQQTRTAEDIMKELEQSTLRY